ncbi:MAG: oligosaccharide flippase family protein [Acidimicrobiia bacterium]
MTGEALTGRPAGPGHGRTFGHALKWSYVMDVGRQGMTLLVTFVLAGILGPGTYGVVAMAAVYIAFLRLLLAQGMVPAVIQRPDLRRAHTDAAFWMVMGMAIPLVLVTIPLSGWWAALNDTPELGPVVMVLSLMLPIEGLKVVHEALLRRDLDIRPLAVRTNVSVLAGAVVGVVLAVVLRNVWALVAQQLTTSVVDVAMLWRFNRWRPRARFDRRAARDLLSFTAGSSFASFGVFLNNRADVLVTGLFFGPVAVGLYRFASRLVDTAITVTVTSLQGAALPELSRHQHDPRHFAERFVVVVRAGALLSLPLLGVLAGVADPLMGVIGDRWEPAVAPLMILCVMGAGRALTMLNGPMLQALGRPGRLAWLAWLHAGISAGSFVVAGVLLRDAAVDRQVVGMSWSRAVLWAGLFLVINMGVLRWATEVRMAAVARAVGPSALAGLAGAAAGVLVGGATAGLAGDLVRLVVVATAGAVVALLVLYATDGVVRTKLAGTLATRGRGGQWAATHAPGFGTVHADAPQQTLESSSP